MRAITDDTASLPPCVLHLLSALRCSQCKCCATDLVSPFQILVVVEQHLAIRTLSCSAWHICMYAVVLISIFVALVWWCCEYEVNQH